MISYAQNFEDVILRRVFRDQTDGFYIDVGAMDPVIESVTKFFYDQGWSGINIEPNEWFYNKLVQERPRDINLNIAVGEKDEEKDLYLFEHIGNSTFDDSSRDRYVERGFDTRPVRTTVKTLATICGEYVTRGIDFLKIDCEGWEKYALGGADWDRFRPIVLIVEATEPGTTTPAWHEWEPFLVENAHYDMVYFDGLNRFYLRKESAELRSCFELPPNFFDHFKLYATEKADREWQSLNARFIELEEKFRLAVAENLRLQEQGKSNQVQIAELQEQGKSNQVQIAGLQEKSSADTAEIERLTRELSSAQRHSEELNQKLLETRLWVGQLSQELAASKRR